MSELESRWTLSQRKAIDFDGGNLILSAAAGSGKTDTLTERIIRLLREGTDLSKIIAVTFSNAAADELRERIGAALEKMITESPENKHAAVCLASLDSAGISTIDSFFKSEITPYAAKLGLPPDFSVINESQTAIMRKEAMEEALNGFFESPTDDFEYLCECFSSAKNEATLTGTLLSVRNDVVSKSIGISSESHENTDFMSTAASLPVKQKMREAGEYFAAMFAAFERELGACVGKSGPKAAIEAASLADIAKRMIRASDETYECAKAFFDNAKNGFSKLSATAEERACDCYPLFKSTRDEIKKLISSLSESVFCLDDNQYKSICQKNARLAGTLNAVLDSFEKIYSEKKKERGGVDYADLGRYAEKLFCKPDGSPTPEAIEAGSKYDFILIDEYQDTSLAQDRVFAALSAGCGRFMVGDVKQAIYGFRGTRPELFTSYREAYTKEQGGSAIFLSENFRSDKNIIDFTNMVSEVIFKSGAAPFTEEDRLIMKKQDGDKNTSPCDIALIEIDKEDKENFEPDYVADRIVKILNGDEQTGCDSPCPGDIAILLRKSKNADAFENALLKRGVPVNNSAKKHFFSGGEVLLVLCLVNAADNPLRDVDLAGALKSHIFGFSLEDLVRLRGRDKDPLWFSLKRYAERSEKNELSEKCKRAVDKINLWREKSTVTDALEILRFILSDTGMLHYGGDGTRSSSQVASSMKKLMNTAANVAKSGGNLHDLTVMFKSLVEKEDKESFVKNPACVSIMTIHQSKGLGFPICFLCSTESSFSKNQSPQNTESGLNTVIITSEGQLASQLYDEKGLVRYKTPHFESAKLSLQRSEIQEQARVLYVALTRAKNKLIITVPDKDGEEKLKEKWSEKAKYPVYPYQILSSDSFKDWIIYTALRNTPSSAFSLLTVQKSDISNSIYNPAEAFDTAENPFAEFFENARDDAEYANAYLENIPAKLTVSALKPDILNETQEESSYFDKAPVFEMPENPPTPRFLEKEKKRGGAESGIATHTFLQFCDFERLQRDGAKAELENLIRLNFISRDDAELVRISEIEGFCKSDIFKRMLGARTLLREKRFNARLPAENFTTEAELREKLRRDGVKITVQGVVDCIFIDSENRCVLLDYKTDRLSKEELQNKDAAAKKLLLRHRRQLEIYGEVCSGLLGRSIDEIYIYSLPLGDTIEVK